MIGKIQRVSLKEVWKHEAHDFTPWLQDNIDILNDVLDLSLSSAEREQAAGDFSVDLVAEDEAGNAVIIENQLGKSDHDHLGKLITYLTAIGAKTAIWIAGDPRPEHVGAITWLNESSSGSFYLVKVEAVQIEGSVPAPLFTLIVGPSAEGRVVGETKRELAERFDIRHRFWTKLLEKAKHKTKLHVNISPSQYHWLGASAGKSGLGFNYIVRKHDAYVEFYIDRGKDAGDENTAIFDALAASKGVIESDFGEPLLWQQIEGKRACRIKKDINLGGFRDEDKWPEVQDAMIDAMIRLEKALRPHIEKLQV
ncbi:MAG: DUF4268 domain-containing protein [Candidatus Brocadiales bacterium]